MKQYKWAFLAAASLLLPGFDAISADNSCDVEATPISKIQGSGQYSTLKGRQVTVKAVVSAAMPKLGGYFLLEQTQHWDKSDKTSEGIFVHDDKNHPGKGDLLTLRATVDEFKGLTQLNKVSDFKVCAKGQSIKTTAITLPLSSADELERYEGMPVSFAQTLTISDNYGLTRYGQLMLSNGRIFHSTNVALPGAAADKVAAANKLNEIVLDDGSAEKNPPIDFDVNHPYRTGNTVTGVEGIVHYSFGNYLIESTATPQYKASNPRIDGPHVSHKGKLRISSFNVLNYFNGNGPEKTFPTERGADSLVEYQRQNAKTVAAMKIIAADVFGLMEVENDGYKPYSAIAELTGNLAKASGIDYRFINPKRDKLGNDVISVGMVYNADKLEPIGKTATLETLPFGGKSRLPLAQSFRQKSDGKVFTLVVNHFKSKGHCPKDKQNPDADQGDGQGCWVATRTESARLLAKWLKSNPTGVKDGDVLIIGDLNAYAKEDPVTTLEKAGFVNLVEKYLHQEAYSFVYRGEAGYLDHALASQSMAAQVVDVADWHINADELRITDYNMEHKNAEQLKSLYKANAFRSSDHDPVIIEVTLN